MDVAEAPYSFLGVGVNRETHTCKMPEAANAWDPQTCGFAPVCSGAVLILQLLVGTYSRIVAS